MKKLLVALFAVILIGFVFGNVHAKAVAPNNEVVSYTSDNQTLVTFNLAPNVIAASTTSEAIYAHNTLTLTHALWKESYAAVYSVKTAVATTSRAITDSAIAAKMSATPLTRTQSHVLRI